MAHLSNTRFPVNNVLSTITCCLSLSRWDSPVVRKERLDGELNAIHSQPSYLKLNVLGNRFKLLVGSTACYSHMPSHSILSAGGFCLGVASNRYIRQCGSLQCHRLSACMCPLLRILDCVFRELLLVQMSRRLALSEILNPLEAVPAAAASYVDVQPHLKALTTLAEMQDPIHVPAHVAKWLSETVNY